jgi:hypothetical protein
MFDTSLRQFKDRVGTPLARRMRRVPPMLISILALLVGLLAAYAAFKGQYLWAFGLWYLNRVLDGLDGLIARLHEQTNRPGRIRGHPDRFRCLCRAPIGLVAGSLRVSATWPWHSCWQPFTSTPPRGCISLPFWKNAPPATLNARRPLSCPRASLAGLKPSLPTDISIVSRTHHDSVFRFCALVLYHPSTPHLGKTQFNLTPDTGTYDT